MRKLLVIGKNWPEPNTTAAGYRILQLLEIFKEAGYQIHFSCAAQKSSYSLDLNSLQIIEKSILLNDVTFDDHVKELQPELVLYDRFMTEEQYGWRVREQSPQSIQILDTEDLHFLRKAREVAFKKDREIDLFNETAMREIAAIYRCDMSIIISQVEQELLLDKFKIPSYKLMYVPFLYDSSDKKRVTIHKTFEERSNFIMIGNSLHEPNYDAILNLKQNIWSEIRKQLPDVEVHIYGAYQSHKIQQLHNLKDGFLIKGFAKNALETLEDYKVMLAPLRFGAGLKGKIFDGILSQTPAIMTSIAVEGMFIDSPVYGYVEDEYVAFANKSVALYRSPSQWNEITLTSDHILEKNYSRSAFAKAILLQINNLQNDTEGNSFMVNMLNFHSNAKLKYMSRWITLKEMKSV